MGNNENDQIFIIYNDENINQNNNFINIIKKKYSNIQFIKLNYQTKGASETIYIGLQDIIKITNLQKTVLLDCDTFYTQDVLSLYRNIEHNAVFYVNNTDNNTIFSYITFNNNGNIIDKIVEIVP